MVNKQVLQQMGFVANMWDINHEVWYHDSNFWVHFGKAPDEYKNSTDHCDGDNTTMEKFFELFLENHRDGMTWVDEYEEYDQDWVEHDY